MPGDTGAWIGPISVTKNSGLTTLTESPNWNVLILTRHDVTGHDLTERDEAKHDETSRDRTGHDVA